MKIVLVNRYFHPDQSATSRMVSSLAFNLAAEGYEVVAVCGRGRRDGAGALPPARERIRGVEVHRVAALRTDRNRLAGRLLDDLALHAGIALRLAAILRRGDICVVCTDPPLHTVSAAPAIALRGARLVNWVMDLFPEVAIELGFARTDRATTRLALALRDLSLRRAARIVCPIDAMRDRLAARGLDPSRVTVLHHWSDEDGIAPVARADNALRRAWGFGDELVVGYSGNFGRAHDFDTLIGAAEALKGERDIRFVMIGDGARRQAVEAEVTRRGLTSVSFHPLQPREVLAQSLCVADVHLVSLLPPLETCIVPSKFYGVLAAGRPTLFVGAAEGEVPRVATRHGCGFGVTVGDVAGLVSHIRTLRDDPEARLGMGRRARQLFLSDYRDARGLAEWRALVEALDERAVTHTAERTA
ncbi:glycosyltransferase family 4 protein [Oceaniglobus roseus]|uniref:glycosyltransferase family 4 protein n=1 Tax=Oceaniglobus roseus TaxID=1737570 RepID=UPI000C7EFAF8|nr:glycosyltransferase family 4 protein [Kandeliimicrobium roseum]